MSELTSRVQEINSFCSWCESQKEKERKKEKDPDWIGNQLHRNHQWWLRRIPKDAAEGCVNILFRGQ